MKKLHALWALLRSRAFVLMTDQETIVYGDMTGLDDNAQIHIVKDIIARLKELLTELNGGVSWLKPQKAQRKPRKPTKSATAKTSTRK